MYKKNKKVAIITGVTSFLGKSVASFLIKKGFIVFGIVRPDSNNKRNVRSIENLNLIVLDFNAIISNEFNNYSNLQSINDIKELKADITFIHFAWEATLDRTNFAKQMMNIDMSSKVLEFAKILGVNKFIFAGSQAEMSESAYGMAKKQFASIAIDNLKNNKMQFIHFRIFSIYGKDDRENSLLKQLVKSFKDNKDIELSSCEFDWNYLYIDDFVKIVYKFITNKVENGTYDIASDDTRLLKDYVIEAHNVYGATNNLLFCDRRDSIETFAIPNIKSTINAVGSIKFTKFSDGILNLD